MAERDEKEGAMPAAAAYMNTGLAKIAANSGGRKRTLVVDDSATILHAICALLDHYQLVEIVGRAENGSETLDRVRDLRPELVLLDADMPGMSGLRTALLLSQLHPEIEIVLMSMDTGAPFRAACSGCGATAIIYKPKFLNELRNLLQKPLEKTVSAGWSARLSAAGHGRQTL
jgi:DNA-binding NarL/FixJ family response regulator